MVKVESLFFLQSMKVDAIDSRTIPKAVQFHIVSVMDYLSLNFYSSCKHMSYIKSFFFSAFGSPASRVQCRTSKTGFFAEQTC